MAKAATQKTKAPKAKAQSKEVTSPRATRYPDDGVIVVKQKDNPKKPKTEAHKKYALLLEMSNGGRKQVRVGDYREAFVKAKFGGDGVGRELTHCIANGYVEVREPKKQAKAS